jgi:hypothetical protein
MGRGLAGPVLCQGGLAGPATRCGTARTLGMVAMPRAPTVAWLPPASGATRWSEAAGRAPVRVRPPAGKG